MKRPRRIAFPAFVFLNLLAATAAAESRNSADRPAVGTAGMISTAHPLATQAGWEILRAGGNAFDATVAVAAVLGVVEPMMSGIGGYGAFLVHDARTRETKFLDCSGRIPAAVDADVFRPPTPGHLENRRGAKSVSTPGNINGWTAMLQRHGTFQNIHSPNLPGVDMHERERWRGHPHFDWAATFVDKYDQAACDPNYDCVPLAFFEPMVQRLFARKPVKRPHKD
jgi:hypothetical protein